MMLLAELTGLITNAPDYARAQRFRDWINSVVALDFLFQVPSTASVQPELPVQLVKPVEHIDVQFTVVPPEPPTTDIVGLQREASSSEPFRSEGLSIHKSQVASIFATAAPSDVSDSEIKTFTVNGLPVRGLKVDGKAAVYGADFAAAMGYADPNAAIKRHCKVTTKRRIPTPGGIQEVTVIFLGDINRLICHSQLPAAEAFEREVMEVILPAIQRTGTYTVPSDPAVLAAQSNIAAAKQAASPNTLHFRPGQRMNRVISKTYSNACPKAFSLSFIPASRLAASFFSSATLSSQ